jgi:putative aldouronate transport system permease protein
MVRISSRRVRESAVDRWFDAALVTVVVLVLFAVLYPLYFIVIASFSEPESVYMGRTWFYPHKISLYGYERILQNELILVGYRNSIFYTSVGAATSTFVTLLAAFGLSKKGLRFKREIMLLIVFTMLFQGGLVPRFLVIRNLGIYNSIWAMLLPRLVGVMYLTISKTYFEETISQDLKDAVSIDGGSDFVFFFRIALPISTPLVAMMLLFYGVNYWNMYFDALVFLQDKALYPLQLVLRNILLANQDAALTAGETDPEIMRQQMMVAESMKYGLIVVSTAPMIVAYVFLQRYFVKGVMLGAIKG